VRISRGGREQVLHSEGPGATLGEVPLLDGGGYVATAIATEPSLLLLDEPTAGMNPSETLELRDNIRRMRDERGITILVIEHDMRVVKGVSDRVVALDYGRKIAEGTYDEVAHDERVIEAYLGTKAAG